MRKIYLLTCKNYERGNASLQILGEFIKARGEFGVEFCIWQELLLSNLKQDDIILPLAMWDYSLHYEKFLRFLDEVKERNLRLFNEVEILRKNSSKLYVKELKELDLPVIESLFLEEKKGFENELFDFKQKHEGKKFVIKPLVGQSGFGVAFLDEFDEKNLKKHYANGALVQIFEENIKKGEFCYVFFNGALSHCFHRVIPANEWRANSKYGTTIKPCEAKERALQIASKAFKKYVPKALYARVDLIERENSSFIINEIELIEPNLCFDSNEKALKNFYEALKARI